LIMDTGCPPPFFVSQEAHAGCLSFEFSRQQQRIIVNCGLPAINRETWRQVARATAAHSTAGLNDTSSCRVLDTVTFKRVIGIPIIAGPTQVPVGRDERDGAILLRASHNGYAERFGLLHQRAIRLAVDGNRLDGEDLFAPAPDAGRRVNPNDEFA